MRYTALAMPIHFAKYHALGNDYLVLDPATLPHPLPPGRIRRLCDRHYGVGSDGVLWGPLPATEADFGLRLFNPDGSEFEKSGNGLRIFARYLWDRRLVTTDPFTVATAGGVVTCRLFDDGRQVSVAMGRVSFHSTDIPVTGPPREVIDERLEAGGRQWRFCAATVGNPHCVVVCAAVDADTAQRYGPLIETHPLFPKRTNVQFMQVEGPSAIRIEIWERGAGYTLASGSSSCAAAAAAHRLGLVNRRVVVHMPGGALNIHLAADETVTMTGPVTHVGDGVIAEECFDWPEPL